ncbi:hypothetical protein JW905_10690 [bacterium]|nr:hypothetical protein [candidate division CSSED10-310 bacterium]
MVGTPAFVQEINAYTNDSLWMGKLAIARKLGLKKTPGVTTQDNLAIDYIQRDAMFWIGGSYDRRLRDQLIEQGSKAIEEGVGRRNLARRLSESFSASFPRHRSYFAVLGSSITSRARYAGGMYLLASEDVEFWEWVTSGDERVCPICGRMNGMIFSVARSVEILDTMMNADSPEAVKSITPWIRWDQNREWEHEGKTLKGSAYYVLPQTGMKRYYLDAHLTDPKHLQKRGIGQGGQVHGGCRCYLLPSGKSMSVKSYPVSIPADTPRSDP